MIEIDRILRKANIYSIEYTGFFSIKFSLSNESSFYSLNELIIEFVSGIKLFEYGNEIIDIESYIYKVFGMNVTYISISNETKISIDLEKGFSIESDSEKDELIDRNWVIRSLDNNTYIINDCSELFYSDDLKKEDREGSRNATTRL